MILYYNYTYYKEKFFFGLLSQKSRFHSDLFAIQPGRIFPKTLEFANGNSMRTNNNRKPKSEKSGCDIRKECPLCHLLGV